MQQNNPQKREGKWKTLKQVVTFYNRWKAAMEHPREHWSLMRDVFLRDLVDCIVMAKVAYGSHILYILHMNGNMFVI